MYIYISHNYSFVDLRQRKRVNEYLFFLYGLKDCHQLFLINLDSVFDDEVTISAGNKNKSLMKQKEIHIYREAA